MRKLYLLLLFLIILLFSGAGCIKISTTKNVDGGIFRSDDGGETWIQKVLVRQEKKKTISINNVNVGLIEFHPQDRNIIYLGTLENGIYYTKDGGEHWESFGLTSGEYSTISIDPKTPNLIYTATGASILKNSDQGVTWEIIYLEPRNQKITSLNVDSYDSSKIYAATEGGAIIQSTDWGESWSVLSTLKYGIKKLYLNSEDTRIIYAVTKDQGIFKSTDGGKNWNSINADLEKYQGTKVVNWFTFMAQYPNIIYIATNYGLLKSTNGGENWEPINTLFPFGSVPIKTVAVNPVNHSEMWFTIGKVIHKTTDGSTTWKTIETFPSTRTITTLVLNPDNPETIYAGTESLKKKK